MRTVASWEALALCGKVRGHAVWTNDPDFHAFGLRNFGGLVLFEVRDQGYPGAFPDDAPKEPVQEEEGGCWGHDPLKVPAQ